MDPLPKLSFIINQKAQQAKFLVNKGNSCFSFTHQAEEQKDMQAEAPK